MESSQLTIFHAINFYLDCLNRTEQKTPHQQAPNYKSVRNIKHKYL